MRGLTLFGLLFLISAGPAPNIPIGRPGRSPAPPASQPARNAAASVSIKGMRFQPATLTIKPGQTVTWTNNDDRDHTVNASDGSFKSGNLPAGSTFSYTFKTKGRFFYTCSYHPRMKAVVIVSD